MKHIALKALALTLLLTGSTLQANRFLDDFHKASAIFKANPDISEDDFAREIKSKGITNDLYQYGGASANLVANAIIADEQMRDTTLSKEDRAHARKNWDEFIAANAILSPGRSFTGLAGGALLGGTLGYTLNKAAGSKTFLSRFTGHRKRYAAAAGTTYLGTKLLSALATPLLKKVLASAAKAYKHMEESGFKTLVEKRKAMQNFERKAALCRLLLGISGGFSEFGRLSTLLPLWNIVRGDRCS